MGEDERNISDDMSSLLRAAEEWANERLFGVYSSNDLNDSISYPIYVPIEEVARQVVLEICKTYEWNPETGTDNRLPGRNTIDTTTTQQSSEIPILRNIFQRSIFPSSVTKLNGNEFTATPEVLSPTEHFKYHQQETSLHTIQPFTTTCEDTVDKAFAVGQNTSLNKPKQLDTSDQVGHINNAINKTFAIKKNASLKMMKEFNASDQIIHDNSKRKSGKVAILHVMDTIPSLAEHTFCDNKISAVHKVEENSYISSNDNYSDILNKNRVSNSEKHPENVEQKLLPAASQELAANPMLNTAFSPANIDYQRFVDNNFITSTPYLKSLKENQRISEILAIRNSGSNNISSQSNVITVHRDGNTVNSRCASDNSNIIATKNIVTVLTPNETVTGTSMFTTNEIIRPAFPKASMNGGDMRRNIANLPEVTNLPENDMSTPRTVIIANTTLEQFPPYSGEKEKDLRVTNSMRINASQNDAPYRTLSEENRALIIELNEKLNRLQTSNNLSQFVVQKSENHNFTSAMTMTHPEKLENLSHAVEEFKNTTLVIAPKINTITQTQSSTDPCDKKNCADLGKKINLENTSQKQLINNDEDTDLVTSIIAIADNQKQVIPSHRKNCSIRCNNRQAFQAMTQNSISLHENDFKDMTGKEFITRAMQTDQENNSESYNNLCDKFNHTPNNTSLPIMNTARDGIKNKATVDRRPFLNDPIKFFNYMASPPRRKSLPASRGILGVNKSNMFARQTIVRPKTIREIIRKTPTMMTHAAKIEKPKCEKQNVKTVHFVRPINPPKKPNELPLENRASRLKAEYLAKKRAEEAKKSQMMKDEKLTPVMAGRLSVMRKLTSINPNVAKSNGTRESNISSYLNASNQINSGRKTLSPINEIPQIKNHAKP
ncbi:unnamed protein product [Cercopithifilaria johnstoni]|uniref:Uncharacterized protein n=1 Tax=Cercopithifilaria johnstoni TaxID=2874296 RepID=A0A8J2M9K8_9BILA|nr:unnamed protein product [Cercopithifilaria johnstoni]